MIVRIISWCTESALIGLILLSPWAFGAVHPPFELWVAYGIAAVLVLVSVRIIAEGRLVGPGAGTQVSLVSACLYGLFLVSTIQTVPLPQSALAVLSPNVPRLCDELAPANREVLLGTDTPVGRLGRWSAGDRLSLNPGGSYEFSVRLLALTALFFAVGGMPNTRSVLLRISIAGAVAGAALAFFSLTQYVTASPELIYGYFQFKPGGFGPFINKNHYPFYANLALGLTMGLLLDRFSRSKREWLTVLTQDSPVLWLLAGMVFIMASVVVCLSRGGVVAMVFALAICAIAHLRPGQNARTLFAVLASVSGLAILLTWIGFDLFASRLSTIAETDQLRDDGRWHLWSAAVATIAQFPLFGSGGETFRYWETIVNQDAGWNSAGAAAIRSDNEFLDIWAEYGIVGVFALLTIAGTVLWHGFRLARQDGLAAGGFMALVAIIAHSCLDFGLRVPACGVFATIVAALVCGLTPLKRTNAARSAKDKNASLAPDGPPARVSMLGRLPGIGVAFVLISIAFFIVNEKRRHAGAYGLRIAGLRALQAGDLDSCVENMERSVAAVPEDVLGRIDASRTILLAASTTRDPEVRNARTRAALRNAVVARDLCPLAHEPFLWLAQYVDQLKIGDTQMEYLVRAHRLHPSDSDISYALGSAYYDVQQYDDVWQCWHRSLVFSNKYLSKVLTRSREHLKPTEVMETILPNELRCLFEAAGLAEKGGHADEAKAYLDRAVELLSATNADDSQTAESHALAASVYQKLGKVDESIAAYRRAVASRPGETEWRLELVQLIVKQEMYDEAYRELRTVLLFQPENTVALRLKERLEKLQKQAKR